MSRNYEVLKEKYIVKLKTCNKTSYIKFLDSESVIFSNSKKFYEVNTKNRNRQT